MLKPKFYISCILILLCFLRVVGQKDSADEFPKWKPYYSSIQLNIGYGVPLGGAFFSYPVSVTAFPGVPVKSENWGQALPGYNLNLIAQYPLVKSRLGIMIMSDYEVNSFDNSTIYGNSMLVVTGKFSEFSLLGGVFFSLPVKYSLIDFRVMAGSLFFKYPGVSFSAPNNNGSPSGWGNYDGSWVEEQGNTVSFAYDIGVGLRHLMGEKIFISLNVDILRSFKENIITQTGQFSNYNSGPFYTYKGPQSVTVVGNNSLDLEMLNISVGLGYKF